MTEIPRPGFDRLRRRRIGAAAVPGRVAPIRDSEGRRALFSPIEARLPLGGVSMHCSSCGQPSALTVSQALRAMVPSVHLPLLKRAHPSWMRCPSCHRRTWVTLSLRI